MEALDNVMKLIGSYPTWAKILVLAGVVMVIGTLILAPRNADSQQKKAPVSPGGKADRVVMRIKPLRLFPESPDLEVRVSAYVNDTEFIHPSIGAEWMKVGPGMSEKFIELPKSERYAVRFSMQIRNGNSPSNTWTAVSQEVISIGTLPHSGEYKLYNVNSATKTRSAGTSAVIPYEIYRE